MSEFLSKLDFIKAIRLGKLSAMANPLMKLFGIKRMNRLYDDLHPYEGEEFINGLLEKLDIEYELAPEELDYIPIKGAFITISNHPFGMLDSLILLKLTREKRADFKLLCNHNWQQTEQMKGLIVPEFGDFKSPEPAKIVFKHIADGGGLGLFPGGNVSRFIASQAQISDTFWEDSYMDIISQAKLPVIPVFFQGSNSKLFYLMNMLNPGLGSAVLPSQIFNNQNSTLKIRIGRPIKPKEYEYFEDKQRMGRYLRARTYSLGSSLKVAPFFRFREGSGVEEPQAKIVDKISVQKICSDIDKLKSTEALLFSQGEFDLYIASSDQLPHILPELGRLREITFRNVGEGTGQAFDLDEYDLYYEHMFIWDREKEKLVGAYRVGKGKDIMQHYGKRGFYTYSLFKMDSGFESVLSQSMELGRSFVLPEYQRHRLPLFLLWKGIVAFFSKHTEYRYIIGPVSISNQYSKVSRKLMVGFIKKFYFDHELAALIKPRKKFRSGFGDMHFKDLMQDLPKDLRKVDQLIADIEPAHFRLPVLLKKYIKQNARMIGFNVDPKFNNALDGFMILDLKELPENTVEDLS